MTDLGGPSHANVGETVEFVFSYRFFVPWFARRYDDIRSSVSLDFGDGNVTPVSFSGLSGRQTFSHSYSEAGHFTASLAGMMTFVDRRWSRSYGTYCYRSGWRKRCRRYFAGYHQIDKILWTGTLNDISTKIEVHSISQVASNTILPATAGTALPEPATLALFGIGLAGVGVAARRQARRATET